MNTQQLSLPACGLLSLLLPGCAGLSPSPATEDDREILLLFAGKAAGKAKLILDPCPEPGFSRDVPPILRRVDGCILDVADSQLGETKDLGEDLEAVKYGDHELVEAERVLSARYERPWTVPKVIDLISRQSTPLVDKAYLARVLAASKDSRALDALLDLYGGPGEQTPPEDEAHDSPAADDAASADGDRFQVAIGKALRDYFTGVADVQLLREWRAEKGGAIAEVTAEDLARLSLRGACPIEDRRAWNRLVEKFIDANRSAELRVDIAGTGILLLPSAMRGEEGAPDLEAMHKIHGQDAILISISNVAYDEDGELALVYFSWMQDPLAGSGSYRVLRKVGGDWTEIASFGGWIARRGAPARQGDDLDDAVLLAGGAEQRAGWSERGRRAQAWQAAR